MSLPQHLQDEYEKIQGYATDFGLDYFETIFNIIDYDRINEIAAYGGFPTRYPHWRFGMEYEQLSKSYEYGLSKIYEMVINTNPAYAYLMEGNSMVMQKTVMAHVLGHVDFFKHNYYFSKTNRKMVDQMANHATRVRRLIDRLGIDKVETFIDTCLSLDNLIDYQSPFVARYVEPKTRKRDPIVSVKADKLPARSYMDTYINPPDVVAKEREDKLQAEEERRSRFPQEVQGDVLRFLLDFAPLDGWEQDILSIIRDEAYYFAPQGMTKIMNEGWATYWHSRIMCEKAMTSDEMIDYADAYAGVVATAPGRINPYKIGIELWRDIKERWDRGMFGPEWENVTKLGEREAWDTQAGKGTEKIFAVRKRYNDVTFLDEFLTPDFIERQRLYTFGYNPKHRRWEISDRDFKKVKKQLLDSVTNFGQPTIQVKDGNFRNRSELLLEHVYRGVPLQVDYAQEVLQALHRVWKRPVYISTVVEDKPRLLGFDGQTGTNEAWTP